MINHLPRVKPHDLPLYDSEREVVGGYLSKKASSNSTFNKGKWQKRWFQVETDLVEDTDNYVLIYKESVEDDKEIPQKAIFQLKGATVSRTGGSSFQVTFEDEEKDHIVLAAESKDTMNMWIDTLEKVISFADLRKNIYTNRSRTDIGVDQRFQDFIARRNNNKKDADAARDDDSQGTTNTKSVSPFTRIERFYPTLRLDIDINTIPPATTQRRKFEDMFIADLSRSLNILDSIIDIQAVKPFPGMPWLTTVSFDLSMTVDMVATDMDENDPEYDDVVAERCYDLRRDILEHLHEMVVDKSSPLFQGYITCKLDSSFSKNLIESNSDIEDIEFVSPVANIQDIFMRYKDTSVPEDEVDITHFTVYLEFEGVKRPFRALNPLALKDRDCAIYPFEIRQALGLEGTMQEIFVTPVALVPLGMPKAMSDPIPFAPSARNDGAVCINATRLKAGLTYQVTVADSRGDLLKGLSDEELDQIKDIFDQYDQNRDGSISRLEIDDLVRDRVAERRKIIDEKFEELVKEKGVSDEVIERAEEYKKQHYQHLQESQTKLIHMFEMADIDGDGVISFTEFMLAEAWWLKCAINPNKQHLF